MGRLHAAISQPVVGTPAADCCVWVQTTLERAYGLQPATGETLALWRLFEPLTMDRVWGPVLAAVNVGIAETIWRPPTILEPTAGARCLVQGWRTDPLDGVGPDSGHTWLWLACADGQGIVVDSTRSSGVRVRGLVRWSDEVAQYRHGVAVAVLRAAR